MKTLFVIGTLLLASVARGEWSDIKAGLDERTVVARIGVPLQWSKSRSGAQVTWTYDLGGHIIFERGRVRYWQAPQPKQPWQPGKVVPAKPAVDTRLAYSDRR